MDHYAELTRRAQVVRALESLVDDLEYKLRKRKVNLKHLSELNRAMASLASEKLAYYTYWCALTNTERTSVMACYDDDLLQCPDELGEF